VILRVLRIRVFDHFIARSAYSIRALYELMVHVLRIRVSDHFIARTAYSIRVLYELMFHVLRIRKSFNYEHAREQKILQLSLALGKLVWAGNVLKEI
jgi:hypothetical protein